MLGAVSTVGAWVNSPTALGHQTRAGLLLVAASSPGQPNEANGIGELPASPFHF